MKNALCSTVVALSLAAAARLADAGPSMTWDFSSGLNGWATQGNVSAVDGQALLSDDGPPHAELYIPWDVLSQDVILEFDVRTLSIGAMQEGTLPDLFAASLYFVDDLSTLDLAANGYDRAEGLLVVDADGFRIVQGILGESNRGPEWEHYRIALQNRYRYAIPVFELYDQNFVAGDSALLLDNVVLVPEPASLGLALWGAVIAGLCRRRRRGGDRAQRA